MHSITNRKNIISFLFLIHFLFYAITPLSFSLVNNTSHDLCLREIQNDNKNFHLYIFDVICSQISQYSVKQHHDSSQQFILLKKKRAILQEDETERSLQALCVIVTDNDSIGINYPVQFSFAIDNEISPSKSFRSSFSGLSPPLV